MYVPLLGFTGNPYNMDEIILSIKEVSKVGYLATYLAIFLELCQSGNTATMGPSFTLSASRGCDGQTFPFQVLAPCPLAPPSTPPHGTVCTQVAWNILRASAALRVT